ncbi:KOW motif-containing protein [Nitrospira calida]
MPGAAGVTEPAAPAVGIRAGDLVRVLAGPAAGAVGRVRAVEESRALVEVVVWGRGLSVKVPMAELERLAGLPWERQASRP